MSNALTSRLKKKKKGFTLIELIIVIAIIAILAAIAIPSFTTIRENSKKKADEASADTIRKSVITLLTDGTLKQDNASDGSFDVVAATTGGVTINNITGGLTGTAADLQPYFKDVKTPQQPNMKSFHVKIDHTNESVTVTTATN